MSIKPPIASLAASAFVVLAALTGAASAAEDGLAAHRPGRAAAHAALTDGADLPAILPSLPELALDRARRAPDAAGVGKRPDPAREAASQAEQHASANARAAREEAANRVAQSSIMGAVRSATADAHVAAAQARTSNTKAAGHPVGPPHPPGHP